MAFDPIRAEIRFGYGLSPEISPPSSVAEMLSGVSGPDKMADAFPVESMQFFSGKLTQQVELARALRKAKTEEESFEITETSQELRREFYVYRREFMAQSILRRTHSATAFRERLAAFWNDHFTVVGKNSFYKALVDTYSEDAVRPNLSGRFEDMLIAVVTHPMMLLYLDQRQSVGPNSQLAEKRGKGRGLNENLAREVLELHTLGVEGPYSQTDVRELAELFTGLDYRQDKGFHFARGKTEPGPETVLGKVYGQEKGRLEDILAVLRDLARHPVTARHISSKLVMHFVSDDPDPALVDRLTAVYQDTDGDLSALYAALLEAPQAWDAPLANMKPPQDFIVSSLRALAVPAETFAGLNARDMRRLVTAPLQKMGQPWNEPLGPDGWPEEDGVWISPQGMAARLQWAMFAPGALLGVEPDPREFVVNALGADAPADITFAAGAAENRREGVAVVLMSPTFQRR
ncbi:DUF1800 domain-containing protein [Shimia thalassica]|uniref:DUF1800 domain-containing protein n=1 Tax=Shimia thalassica TaxID=1715693 RepID=UPI0027371B40|nr:DUF1800 domain-containing protein [Shimia thalassica]MDP2519258.1 DUF1800 domain-containing protein [Shimia thalassica]